MRTGRHSAATRAADDRARSTQKFDSAAKIGKVDAPILLMHGAADHTVPVALGHELYSDAPKGARWVEFPGGSHSGLDFESADFYRQTMSGFIDQLKKRRPPNSPAESASSPSG